MISFIKFSSYHGSFYWEACLARRQFSRLQLRDDVSQRNENLTWGCDSRSVVDRNRWGQTSMDSDYLHTIQASLSAFREGIRYWIGYATLRRYFSESLIRI